MAELAVQRKPFPPDLPARLARAEQAALEAQKQESEAEREVTRLKQERDKIPPTSPARSAAENAVVTAEARLQVATEARQKAERTRDELRNQLHAKETGVQSVYDVKLELKPPQPDASRAFVAHLAHYEWRDDLVTIGTTAEGLLTTSEGKTTDRIGDILVDIVGTVGMFVTGAPTVTPFAAEAGCKAQNVSLKFIFDPIDYVEGKGANLADAKANRTLRECGFPFRVEFVDLEKENTEGEQDEEEDTSSGSPQSPGNPPTNAAKDQDKSGFKDVAGLLFRRPKPYLAVVERGFGPSQPAFAPMESVIAMLPNDGPLGLLPYEASSFVETEYKVEFQDGQPVKWTADRPSALAEVFRLPVRMAKALVEIPAQLIQLRFNIDTVEAQRAASEVELLKARLAILCEQKRLEVAQAIASGTSADPDALTLLGGGGACSSIPAPTVP